MSMAGFLGMLLVRTTFQLSVVFAVYWLIRRRSAAIRHAWLASGTISLPLLIALPAFRPASLNIPVDLEQRNSRLEWLYKKSDLSSRIGIVKIEELRVSPDEQQSSVRSPDESRSVPFRGRVPDWELTSNSQTLDQGSEVFSKVVLVCWLSAFSFFSLRLIVGHLRAWAFAYKNVTYPEEGLLVQASSVAKSFGMSFLPRIVLKRGDFSPVVIGVFRPVIVLPHKASHWDRSRLETVLRHEFSHVYRQDLLVDLCSSIAVIAVWFQPLGWLAINRMRIEREKACDDLAIRSGIHSIVYARELKSLAAETLFPRKAFISADFARRGTLEDRIAYSLNADIDCDHVPINRRQTYKVFLFTVILAAVLSSVKSLDGIDEMPIPSFSAIEGETETPFADPLQINPRVVEARNDEAFKKTLSIRDENGRAIAGAKVKVSGIGTGSFSTGTQALWALNASETTTEFISDSVGSVSVFLSQEQLAGIPKEAGSIEFFSFTVEHSDFASETFSDYTIQARGDLTLSRGVRFRATAKSLNRLGASQDLYVVSSGNPVPVWSKQNEQLVSPMLGTRHDSQGRFFRFVAFSSNSKVPLFSQVYDASTFSGSESAVALDVEFSAGVTLTGRVERKESSSSFDSGTVFANVYEGGDRQYISWQDTSAINSDGTFRFESLPPDVHVELFAVMDGWLSQPSHEYLQKYDEQYDTNFSQLTKHAPLVAYPVRIDRLPAVTSLNIVQTETLRIEVVDEEQIPLPRVLVGTRLQCLTRFGSIYPELYQTSTELMNHTWKVNRSERHPLPTWESITDEKGYLELRNLVPGPQLLECELAGYTAIPNFEVNPGIEIIYADVVAGEDNHLQIVMKPIDEKANPQLLPMDEEGFSYLLVNVFDSQAKPIRGIELKIVEQSLLSTQPSTWPENWQLNIESIGPGKFAIKFRIPDELKKGEFENGEIFLDVIHNDRLVAKRQSVKLRNPQIIVIPSK